MNGFFLVRIFGVVGDLCVLIGEFMNVMEVGWFGFLFLVIRVMVDRVGGFG